MAHDPADHRGRSAFGGARNPAGRGHGCCERGFAAHPAFSRLPWPPSCLPSHFLALRRFTVRTAGDWSIGLLLLLLPVALWATALPEVHQPPVHRLLMGVLL